MLGYGGQQMRAFRSATAGMPFGIALAWALVDLPLVFGFRMQQVALETCQQWHEVLQQRCAEERAEEDK